VRAEFIAGGAAAVPLFILTSNGALNAFFWTFLLGILVGIVLLGASEVLEMRAADARARGRPRADPPDAPLRIRLRDWGEAFDVSSKVALRFAGVISLLGGGAGALGVGLYQLVLVAGAP
jgi:hypothetical protein